MDLPNHYKLVKEHEKHFELHDERDGKRFNIAKKDIHPAHQLKIMKMQKLAEGGDVEGEENSFNNLGKAARDIAFPSMMIPNPTEEQAMKLGQGAVDFGRGLVGLPSANATPAPAAISNKVAPSEPPHADMSVGSATPPQAPPPSMEQMLAGTPYGEAFKLGEQGIKEQAAATAAGQAQMAKAYEAHQKAMADFEYSSQQEAWNKRTELDNMQEALANQKIDPNRLWHDASTPSKIGAGIALILGGIGAGLSHGPNQAIQAIDKLTERDIEAQKANIGQKNNLYQMNLKRYQDDRLADNATRLQMNAALQNQIQMIAAKTNSAGAIAASKQMLMGLKLQEANMLQQFGVDAAKNKILGVATGEGGIPVTQEHPILMKDKDYVEKRVVVNGNAYQAASPKDAEELRSSAAMLKPIEADLQKLRTIGPAALIPGSPEHQLAEGIIGRLSMNVNEFNGYKRFTDVDAKTIDKQFKNPASFKSLTAGDESTIDALRALRGKMQSEYQSRLVNYRGGQADSFTPMSGKLPLNKSK